MTYRKLGDAGLLLAIYREGIAAFHNPEASFLSCPYREIVKRKAWLDGYQYAERHKRDNPIDADFLRVQQDDKGVDRED